MSRVLANSFLTPPPMQAMLRRMNHYPIREMSSLPQDPSTFGGVIAVIADRLGVGE